MSGLEIVLIVGAGIIITKKVKQHRQEKKLKELAAAGLLPEQHAPAQLVQQKQRGPTEDETLPLYSPPTKEYVSGHLPSYDEVRRTLDDSLTKSSSQPVPGSGNQTEPSSQYLPTPDRQRPRKWKLFKREKSQHQAGPEQLHQSQPVPSTAL